MVAIMRHVDIDQTTVASAPEEAGGTNAHPKGSTQATGEGHELKQKEPIVDPPTPPAATQQESSPDPGTSRPAQRSRKRKRDEQDAAAAPVEMPAQWYEVERLEIVLPSCAPDVRARPGMAVIVEIEKDLRNL